MKCNDCENFKVQVEYQKKDKPENIRGTCVINNTVCDPDDECKAGLLDKTSVI
jgi:hypothetical protein